jgi:hypothetical protein
MSKINELKTIDDKAVDIYKVKDKSDEWLMPKTKIWNGQSLRCLLVAPAGSGKTNFLTNLLLNDQMYLGVWKPENIYIFSGSIEADLKIQKIIEMLGIPEDNIFENYSEEALGAIFELCRESFSEALENDEKPEQWLIVLDDVSFGGQLLTKKSGSLSKVFCNCRKYGCSIIVSAQKLSQIPQVCRNNANGIAMWSSPNRELDHLAENFDYTTSPKHFKQMFRDATDDKHSFLTVDLTNEKEKMYSKSFQKYYEII